MFTFTFILNNFAEHYFNYPKYMIILMSQRSCYFHSNNVFYYLILFNKSCINMPCKFPTYLILLDLYFNRYNKNDKFNLSKLGLDYILNNMPIHFQNECIGSYPDNYVFVIEPEWPYDIEDRTDRIPLKCTYQKT